MFPHFEHVLVDGKFFGTSIRVCAFFVSALIIPPIEVDKIFLPHIRCHAFILSS
jgi:hypothetical protein